MLSQARQSLIRFIIFTIILLVFFLSGKLFNIQLNALEGVIERFPILYSGIVFILLYVVVTFFIWLSKDIFRIAAAIIFGPYVSTILVYCAETINAAILFNFSRYFARGFVEAKFRDKYPKLDAKISGSSFLWLFLFRLVPLIPFRFFDLAAGISTIPFKKYFRIVIFASPLRIFWLQFFLAALGKKIFSDPFAMYNYLQGNKFAFIITFLYFILIIIVFLKLRRKNNVS